MTLGGALKTPQLWLYFISLGVIFGLSKMLNSTVKAAVMVDPSLGLTVQNVFDGVEVLGACLVGILMTYLRSYVSR